MKKIRAIILAGLIVSAAALPEAANAGGNRNRNTLIATSALGGTLAGAILGIFADRAFKEMN